MAPVGTSSAGDERAVATLHVVLDHHHPGRRGEHGRGRHSHPEGSDTAEVLRPEEIAVQAECVEALRPEPGDDPLAVARRSGIRVGTDPVAVVVGERAGAHHPPPAENSAVAVEREQQHVQPLVGAQAVGVQELLAADEMGDGPVPGHLLARDGAGQKDEVPDHDGRRMAAALDRRFPDDVLVHAPAERRAGLRLGPAAGAAPLGPARRRVLGRPGARGGRETQGHEGRHPDGAIRRKRHCGGVVAPAPGDRKA